MSLIWAQLFSTLLDACYYVGGVHLINNEGCFLQSGFNTTIDSLLIKRIPFDHLFFYLKHPKGVYFAATYPKTIYPPYNVYR